MSEVGFLFDCDHVEANKNGCCAESNEPIDLCVVQHQDTTLESPYCRDIIHLDMLPA